MLQYLSYCISTSLQIVWSYGEYYTQLIVDILDFYTPSWKIYVLSPIVIVFFILPMLLVVYLYISALMLFVYRQRKPLIDAFNRRDIWEGYRNTIAILWSGHGWIWHGYEVNGFENIPEKGPALIIYYHGAFPVDLYYLLSHIYLHKGRVIRNVVDNFVFKVPGLAQFFRFWGSFPGPRSKVVEHLKNGEIVSIAPGGVREALFSENYSLLWKNRVGFAKAAIEAKVPILPMFTENCRQAFDYIGFVKKLLLPIYEYTRWPIMPMYGGFPVKMRTHIGKPIDHDPSLTPEELAHKVRISIGELIKTHQESPDSILKAFLARFFRKKHNSKLKNSAVANKKIRKSLSERNALHMEGSLLAKRR